MSAIANELHSQLLQTLKRLVANATSEFKKKFSDSKLQQSNDAVPISYLEADDEGMKIIDMLKEKHKDRELKVATFPIGGTSLSFNLPADYPLHQIDVDKLVPPEREVTRTKEGVRKFSFNERLKGWNIEIRQREKGDMADSYYHHEKLKKALRSVPEVIGFILYEDPAAVKSEKKRAASSPMEETSKRRGVKVETKQIKTEETELTIDDIPICRNPEELAADLAELKSGQKSQINLSESSFQMPGSF